MREARAALDPDSRAAALQDHGEDRIPVLVRAIADFVAGRPAGTVTEFVAWLEATGRTAEEGERSGVELVTFHRAKGLEWRSVWVVGVDDGLVPLGNGDEAEEHRLLFVALTRAEDELAVSWAHAPSPLISAIEGAVAHLGRQPVAVEQRNRLHSLRTSLPPSPRRWPRRGLNS